MNRFSVKRVLVFSLVGWLMLLPMTADASVGDIISLLTTITNTLRNDVGLILGGMRSINTQVRNFEQQAVWPVAEINQMRAFIGQMRSQFSGLAAQIHSLKVTSATLVSPSQLEAVLRSRGTVNLSQITVSYRKVYPALPVSGQATAAQRNLIDVDDAMALGALKTATVSEAATSQMLNVADGLEQQAANAAPGTASIVTAQAQAANLQSQAMLQRMLAAELRQEAARLAHANALRKQSADSTRDLRNNLQQILGRP